MVRLRKLDKLPKFVGNTAPAFVLRNVFFFNDTATTEIYTLSLHDALPILFSNTSVFALLAVIEVAAVPPVAVIAPDCVMLPPATKPRLRPMLEPANCIAPLVVKLTSLVPLFDKVIAPDNPLL